MVAINDRQDALNLKTFLSRPTLINSRTWGASTLNLYLYPWWSFVTNTYIENKLKNYNLLRANLHLRFEIVGSPFVYGAALVSYEPMYSYLSDATSNGAFLSHTSQRPSLWICPQESAGGEMILPFFWKSNYVNMLDEETMKDLGRLNYYSWVNLDTANDVSIPNLTIQTYAWLEDVVLEGPTSQLILQAGSDEYSKGPIQRIASAVATVANAVAVIPQIAPFAMATSIGARAMGSIAALFGWSKVAVIENGAPVVATPYHGLSSSEISVPIQKLSLDPKTEVTVDPRVVNLTGQDELNINYLTSKKSTFESISWSTEAVGTKIYSIPVHPMLNFVSVDGSITKYSHTPMGYFGQLFQKWRGDIIFTIKIVASQYHRGKLRIAFDPYGLIGADDYSNVIQTQIVDISNTTEIEFTCPYMQDSTWCSMPDAYSATRDFTTGVDVAYEEGFNNGVFAVHVISLLSSPQTVPICHLLFSARGGPNLEFAEPDTLPQDVTHLEIQSGTEITAGKTHPQEYLVNYGENIVSLRQLLSRATYSQRYYPIADYDFDFVGTSRAYTTTSLKPCPFGADEDGLLYSQSVLVPETNVRFTFSAMHPINWVAACFAANRGSTQILLELDDIDNFTTAFYLERGDFIRLANEGYLEGVRNGSLTYGSDDQQSATYIHKKYSVPGHTGMARARASTGNTLHVEAESRSRHLFTSNRQEDWLLGDSKDNSDLDFLKVYVDLKSSKGMGLLHIDKFVNIGPDFNLHFFVNTPILYTAPYYPNAEYVE